MKRMLTCVIRTCGRPLFPEFERLLTVRKKAWDKSPSDVVILVHGDKTKLPLKEKLLIKASGFKVRWWSLITDGSFPSIIYRMFKEYLDAGYEFIMPMDDDADWLAPDKDLPIFIKDFDKDKTLGESGPCVVPYQSRSQLKRLTGKTFKQYMTTMKVPSPPLPMRHPGWTADGSQIHRVSAIKKIDLEFLKKLHFRTDLHLTMSLIDKGFNTTVRVLPRYAHVGGYGQVSKRTPEQHKAFWQKFIGDYFVSLDQFRHQHEFVQSIAQILIWESNHFAGIEKGKLNKTDYGLNQWRLDGDK